MLLWRNIRFLRFFVVTCPVVCVYKFWSLLYIVLYLLFVCNMQCRPDGVVVPYGKGISKPIKGSSLLYNEFIVYDVAQVRLLIALDRYNILCIYPCISLYVVSMRLFCSFYALYMRRPNSLLVFRCVVILYFCCCRWIFATCCVWTSFTNELWCLDSRLVVSDVAEKRFCSVVLARFVCYCALLSNLGG